MKLSIYSLKKVLFEGEAQSLNCKTVVGEITILDNHQSLIGVLSYGVMKIIESNQKKHFFEIKSGFLEIGKNNQVRCIVE